MRTWCYLGFFIMLLQLVSFSSHADEFRNCGIYEIEGYIVYWDEHPHFAINRFSHSEIKVRIDANHDYKPYDKLPILAKIRIPNQCEFECITNFLEVLEELDPFKRPQNPFFPRVKPIKEEKCGSHRHPSSKKNKKKKVKPSSKRT